tara:strand:- start:7353 stop:10139 length:2787 start_codon:yes stop_codon:yes gene_type:complete
MPKQYKIYRDFSGGINTKSNSKFIKDNELVEASGLLCDERGVLRTCAPSTGDGKTVENMDGNMIKAGRGLFVFKSDYSYSTTANTITARESEYLCIADKNTSQIDLYGYDDQGDDHALMTNQVDLGSGTAMFAEFYYADGALRISDGSFNSNNVTKWLGRIGDVTKKKLLGVELDRVWVALDNKLDAPVVGFISTSLSGTSTGDTTSLIHTGDDSGTGLITTIAGSGNLTRFTSSSHGLEVGDVVTITSSNRYNGSREIVAKDTNTFDVDLVFSEDTSNGSSRWVKNTPVKNFQGWTTAVAAANSASRWLIAYDVANNDVWKITAVNSEVTQDLTTSTNSSDWNTRAFDIYPYPGDGVLLEVYQSEGSKEGSWSEGEYEFAQSFIYEGNQESKLTKLEGSNVQIDSNEIVYARVHTSGLSNVGESNTYINQRLIGGRIYIRKIGANNFWSLFIDMDYRVHNTLSGGGTRITTIDDYESWASNVDADTGGEDMGWTDQYFEGFKSVQHTIKRLNIESYENLNGFSPSEYSLSFGSKGAMGYKTSVVAGQRVFVANVYYTDPDSGVEKIMGDSIFYTPVGKYDTFPSSYRLNIAGNDGDEFTALQYSNGVLFAYKKNSLYLIDVSNPNEAGWRLLAKHEGMGVSGDWGVVKTSLGVAWVSKSGLYLFTQNQPVNLISEKISFSDWNSFYDTDDFGPGIGWDNTSNKLVVVDNVKESSSVRMFDLDTKSWTTGYPLATSPGWTLPGGSNTLLSNMVTFTGNEMQNSGNANINPNGGILVLGDEETDDGSSTSTDLYTLDFSSTKNSAFVVVTKDDDFGLPNIFKKVYEIDVEYITDETSDAILFKYEIDGNDAPHSSSNAIGSGGTTLSGVADKDNVNILKMIPSSPIKCRSISFRISSNATTTCYLEIVSIAVRYRALSAAPVATETSSS